MKRKIALLLSIITLVLSSLIDAQEEIQPTIVQEQVKCIFINSNSEQKCYAEGFGCSGIETCIADVSGEKDKTLGWKSSCGGYAYTIFDGNNENIEFKCQQTSTST